MALRRAFSIPSAKKATGKMPDSRPEAGSLSIEARYIEFNYDALCKKAVEQCPGSQSVVGCKKIEGEFNRVFVFTMDDGQTLIARLSFSVAGPPRYVIHSEVATIAYIKSKTSIPVPDVVCWCDSSSNPIGTEYIFMKPVPGVQLHGRWETMTSSEHLSCIESISKMMAQATKLEFPAYGNFAHGFCVGPHCGFTYWNCAPGEASIYCQTIDKGPWVDLSSYCGGLITSARSRIPASVPEDQLPYQGSIQDHVRFVTECEAVLYDLIKRPQVQRVAKPTLLHADLHKRNIFVPDSDPTKITGIIDWQSTSIEPAFIYANETPDFASLVDDVAGTAKDEQDQARQKKRTDIQLCAEAFEIWMEGHAPTISQARALDDTILRLFRHCNTSWRDSVTAVRGDLIDLAKEWNALELGGSCPFQPTQDELAIHEKNREDFESDLSLRAWLVQRLGVTSDGWIPIHEFPLILPAYHEAYEQWIQIARQAVVAGDAEMSVEKAEKLWPFDER
ncbi:uncharacterized protein M437DRAFT_79537 [Aureobasidium melanogenum CBS 110374]|uniref:Altered inheritance of mitochondria protein 9, mitochondrial n=1 Tax=Aureobasidium melanogenum (strain CBS 110374) TaxID=1043003 RepID=A0A074VFE2_AURM1|nr:uncharacterized protein M437DRAFT_79537 [Aureobasidium melanogenum CBS 110374]KEQ57694.1 hypothetical protein M437DRAFT_79537 [Aureobasidium melanogenum CBS 110374]